MNVYFIKLTERNTDRSPRELYINLAQIEAFYQDGEGSAVQFVQRSSDPHRVFRAVKVDETPERIADLVDSVQNQAPLTNEFVNRDGEL